MLEELGCCENLFTSQPLHGSCPKCSRSGNPKSGEILIFTYLYPKSGEILISRYLYPKSGEILIFGYL